MKYLNDLLKAKKIELPNKSPLKVTYKDPCELGRHCGVYEVARDLLSNLPAIENRELTNNRDKALCCGAGGLIKVNHPEIANEIAYRLITQIVEQEVDICVNACPSCLLNIDENIKMQGLEIKTIDIAELVLDRTKNP
jgi:Fe-S oxidoreductase